MESFMCTLDEDFLEFCDNMEGYCDATLDSPCSNLSDQENIGVNSFDFSRKLKKPVKRMEQRRAANMRERRRMRSINDAFDTLRTCIPNQVNGDRRLSKVDTLRLAIRYIGYLGDLLEKYDQCGSDSRNNPMGQRAEKIIVRCNLSDVFSTDEEDGGLMGHSLSWVDDKLPKLTANNRFSAKVWVPELANEADLVSLTTLTTEYAIQ